MKALSAHQAFSLYIHLPWCVKKCPYCDFNSHAIAHADRHQLTTSIQNNYIDCLIADFKSHISHFKNRTLVSIFIGGGTPSLFSGAHIAHLLSAIHRLHPFDPAIEITMEANPGTAEAQRFRAYRAAGVNRLSLGIQSFDDTQLINLGRIHDAAQAKTAIRIAQEAGFENFNLDLMFGLPNQCMDAALNDLNTALSFEPPHLSWYQLTLEPRTVFYKQPPTLPDDDSIATMQQTGIEWLRSHGLNRYEISAFSLPDKQCVHNRQYWEYGDYLGIGAGAHSKVTDRDRGEIHRFVKRKHPVQYMDSQRRRYDNSGLGPAVKLQDDKYKTRDGKHKGLNDRNKDHRDNCVDYHTNNMAYNDVKPFFIAQHRIVEPQDKLFEFMLNALRLCEPIPSDLCIKQTGIHFRDAAPILNEAKAQGLLIWDQDAIELTERGRRFLNNVTEMFLPDKL